MRITRVNIFLISLIGALVLYIIFLQACNGRGKGKDVSSYDLVTVKMNRVKWSKVYYPKEEIIILPGKHIIDSVPYFDSSYCKALAVEYFSTRIYSDTIKGDTADVFLRQVVSRNRVDSLQVGYRVNVPFVTVNNKERFQVYLSGNVGTDLKGFSAGPEIIFRDKRAFLYKLGVDFNTSGSINYRVGFGFKISFRKRK